MPGRPGAALRHSHDGSSNELLYKKDERQDDKQRNENGPGIHEIAAE
jgi:hypothetical protein